METRNTEAALAAQLSEQYDAYRCGMCKGTGSYRDITNADKHYSDAAGTTSCRSCLDGVVWVLKGFTPHWPATEPLEA